MVKYVFATKRFILIIKLILRFYGFRIRKGINCFKNAFHSLSIFPFFFIFPYLPYILFLSCFSQNLYFFLFISIFSVFLNLFSSIFYLSVYLAIYLSFYRAIYPFIELSIYRAFIYRAIYLSSFYLSIY